MAEMRSSDFTVSQGLRADWRDALDKELVALERAARADELAFYSFERALGADRAWQLARVLKALEQRARRVALGPTAGGGFSSDEMGPYHPLPHPADLAAGAFTIGGFFTLVSVGGAISLVVALPPGERAPKGPRTAPEKGSR